MFGFYMNGSKEQLWHLEQGAAVIEARSDLGNTW